MPKLLRPNVDKIGITLLLFLLSSFFFVLFTHPETVWPVWLLILLPLYIFSSVLYKSLTTHSTIWRIFRWIVFTPLILLIALSGISQIVPGNPPKDFLITHNFVDLSQIDNFTKFRSCSGHQTVSQYSDEPVSNMQHYMPTIENVDPDKVKIYAPFDGYILASAPFTLVDEGVTMVPKSGTPWWPFNQWRFAMNHTHVLPEFENPPIHFVRAGTLVGYVNALDRYGQRNSGTQVRVGVTAIPPMFKNGNGEPYKKLDSVFHYMSDSVFGEYKAAIPGLESQEDFIISKEYRLSHPCKFKVGDAPNFDSDPHNLPLEEQAIYIGVNMKDLNQIKKKLMNCYSSVIVNKPAECSK